MPTQCATDGEIILEPRQGYVRATLKRDDAAHSSYITFSPQQAREAGMALLRAAQDADGEVLDCAGCKAIISDKSGTDHCRCMS